MDAYRIYFVLKLCMSLHHMKVKSNNISLKLRDKVPDLGKHGWTHPDNSDDQGELEYGSPKQDQGIYY